MDSYIIAAKITDEGYIWRWYERLDNALLRHWHFTWQAPGTDKEQNFPMYVTEDGGEGDAFVQMIWDNILAKEC